jgi:hypothetical protein
MNLHAIGIDLGKTVFLRRLVQVGLLDVIPRPTRKKRKSRLTHVTRH